MNRTELREQVFNLLFRVELNPMEDMSEQEELFTTTSDKEISTKDADYIREKYENIASKLPEIDEAINKETTGWNTSRIAKVDLTILRLAIYEIKYDETVPTGVAINDHAGLGHRIAFRAEIVYV